MGKSKDGFLMSLGAALLGILGSAAPTGLLTRNAEARVAQPAVRRREDEHEREDPLLVIAPQHNGSTLLAGHSSHRSHSSHSSHYSGSRGGGGGGSRYVPSDEPAPAPPVHHPKPASVSFLVFPGGAIFVDGKLVGHDATRTLKLPAGSHTIKIVNRFVGEQSIDVELTEGQTGVIELRW